MADRVRSGRTIEVRSRRTRQLHRAVDRLEAVFQSLDLEAEPRIAEDVAEAIRAIDRACERRSRTESSAHCSNGFVFPAARNDGGRSRER